MKNLFKITIAAFAILFSLTSKAQQIPLIDHVYAQPFMVNPAHTGLRSNTVSLIHRSQWTDVDGAPETQIAAFQASVLSQKVGLGLILTNESLNLLGNTGLKGIYRYSARIKDELTTNFGVGLSYNQNRFHLDRLNTADPVEIELLNSLEQSRHISADFGILLSRRQLQFGISSQHTFSNQASIIHTRLNERYLFSQVPHYTLWLSNKWNLGRTISLEPALLTRLVDLHNSQTELMTTFLFRDAFQLGLGIRQEFGTFCYAGTKLHDILELGYSYSRSFASVQKLSTNSHEFRLGVILNKGLGKDTDSYGVKDYKDEEKNSPAGAIVDGKGRAMDRDGDGVPDVLDREPQTPANCQVDQWGVAFDQDKDGVPTCLDQELNTPIGAEVDSDGVALDTDRDGVPDIHDLEPLTPHWSHMGLDSNVDASQCIVDRHGRACDSNANGMLDCREKAGLDSGIRTSVERMSNYSQTHDYFVVIGVFKHLKNVKRYSKKLKYTYGVESWTIKTNNNLYYVLYEKVYTKEQARTSIAELDSPELNAYIRGNPWVWQTLK